MRRCSPLLVVLFTSTFVGCGKDTGGTGGAGGAASGDTADSHYIRAMENHQQKKYDEAIKDFDAALKIDAKFAPAYRDRGICYSVKKDYAKAIADLTEYIKLRPDDPDGYESRAVAHSGKGDAKAASADLRSAEKLMAKKK